MADFIKYHVRGVARVERKLKQTEVMAHQAIVDELRRLSVRVQAIFAIHAPGHLNKHIRIESRLNEVRSPAFTLSVNAVDPTTGYNYLGVTRFGHRKKWITPREDRGKATVINTRVLRGTIGGRTQAALRIETSHGVIFRHRVKGQVRHRDWVAEGRTEAQGVVEGAAQRLGRRIMSKV